MTPNTCAADIRVDLLKGKKLKENPKVNYSKLKGKKITVEQGIISEATEEEQGIIRKEQTEEDKFLNSKDNICFIFD
jgi:hypothetical protein